MNTGTLRGRLANRYAIERELGVGGTATVYLARDIRHDRKVAIKVLRPELAAAIGAERFLTEIKTTANLQHPHILSLFDSGQADGTVFYVMPFVDGESLRDRLMRETQLPIGDAVRIAIDVAGALHYAHQRGVIHRDIKPENILLQGGHALVADFGIALAVQSAGGQRMTHTGLSLGTPQYMSPEQATGERELDARTDIYALGCTIYEMLIGEPPITGPTAQAIVAKVVTTEPIHAATLRKSIPPHVADAIHVALQKLPADRFSDAGDFASALMSPSSHADTLLRGPQAARHKMRRTAAALAGVALLAATFLLGGRTLGKSRTASVALGRARHVTWEPGLEIDPAISPDGRFVAYATGPMDHTHIMVRPVGEGRPIVVTTDSDAAQTAPQWSGDGERILYLARGGVFSAPAGGGPATPEIPGTPTAPIVTAVWAPNDNRIVFARRDSLLLRERDGSVHALAPLPDPSLCAWSPVGTFVACASGNSSYALAGPSFGNVSPSRVAVIRIGDGAVTVVTDSTSLNTSPAWTPDGKHLFFVSDRAGARDIYVTAITSSGHSDGEPTRLSAGLGAHTLSLSRNGARVAYSLYSRRSSIWSIPIPSRPPEMTTSATRVTGANEYIEDFAVSADGKWLYYDSDLPGNTDIFRVSTAGGEPQQLTTNPADDFAPFPSPDGKEFSFHSWRAGGSREIFVQRLDGGGVEQITHSPLQEGLGSWSRDGRALAFTMMNDAGGVWIVRRDSTGKWGTPVQRVLHGFVPTWSPDDKEIAFVSSVRGGSVLVMPVDSGPVRVLLDATQPGTPIADGALWGADGTIYFSTIDLNGNSSIWSIAPTGGTPRELLKFDPSLHPAYRPVFSVGSGKVYFASEDRQSDVWVMELERR